MWIYNQRSGALLHNGIAVGTGYSGHGAGLNNDTMDHVADVGPLPCGGYKIGPAYTDESKGPLVMRLDPDGLTPMFGRAGFLIHGDNQRMDHSASQGCIVLSHELRQLIAASPDRGLLVIA